MVVYCVRMTRDVTPVACEAEGRAATGDVLDVEFEIMGALELSKLVDDGACMTGDGLLAVVALIVVVVLAGCRLRDAEPGCWKPESPLDVGAGIALVRDTVGEAGAVDVSSSTGE